MTNLHQKVPKNTTGTTVTHDPAPMFFSVSIMKFIVMSICTLGIYEFYWFYKNWNIIKERDQSDIKPFWRAFFGYFFCHSLLKEIQITAESQKIKKIFSPGPLSAGWIIFTLMLKLPDPYWLVTYLALLFLLPVQTAANNINNIVNPNHEPNTKFTGWNFAAIFLGGPLAVLGIIGTFIPA